MSAADPAPAHPVMNAGGDAAVIPLHDRARRRAGRGPFMMTDHDQTDKTGKADSGSLQRLAEHVETTFNAEGLSLTDDSTAAGFSVTLKLVRGMLEGAQAQGIVDEEQRAELDALFAGVAEIPRLIS